MDAKLREKHVTNIRCAQTLSRPRMWLGCKGWNEPKHSDSGLGGWTVESEEPHLVEMFTPLDIEFEKEDLVKYDDCMSSLCVCCALCVHVYESPYVCVCVYVYVYVVPYYPERFPSWNEQLARQLQIKNICDKYGPDVFATWELWARQCLGLPSHSSDPKEMVDLMDINRWNWNMMSLLIFWNTEDVSPLKHPVPESIEKLRFTWDPHSEIDNGPEFNPQVCVYALLHSCASLFIGTCL